MVDFDMGGDIGGGGAWGIHSSIPYCISYIIISYLTKDPENGGNSWTPGTSGTAITGSQQQQLQIIRDRDAEFDQDLDEIGDGIQDLHELALRQGEEVQRQNAMLSQTQNRIDNCAIRNRWGTQKDRQSLL